MATGSNEVTTRQRILEGAADLFAQQGFTETSIRELAESVGLNPATLYYYFASKNEILEQMLEDYSIYNTDVFEHRNLVETLTENPNTEGVLNCLILAFPAERQDYYLKVLCVLLQEQLRNPIVRSYMSEHFILRSERNISTIIGILKSIGAIREDTDADLWMKLTSSLFYAFATRSMLGPPPPPPPPPPGSEPGVCNKNATGY